MYFNNITLKNFSYLLLCVLPASFVTGPLLPDLFIVLISISFITLCIKDNLWYLFKEKLFKYLFLFFIVIVTSSLFSDHIFFSLKSSFLYIRFIVFLIAAEYFFRIFENKLKYFFYSIFFIILLLIIDSIFQYHYGFNLIGYESLNYGGNEIKDNRITSFFGEDEILGSYLSKIFPIYVAILFLTNNDSNKYLNYLIFLAVPIIIFISGERAAFIHVLMYIIIFLTLKSSSKNTLSSTTIILTLVIIISLIANFNYDKKHRMFLSTYNALKNLHFSSEHTSHYKTALNIFLDRPLLGKGTKTFRFVCSNEKFRYGESPCSTHPHNSYIQLLAETGILSFMIIFSFFVWLSIKLMKHFYLKFFRKQILFDNSYLAILIGLFIYLWPISPHGNFFNNWLSGILYLQLSIFLFLKNKKDKDKLKNKLLQK